jgi:hypothetical protein
MGWWLWRAHPGLTARFDSALGEHPQRLPQER